MAFRVTVAAFLACALALSAGAARAAAPNKDAALVMDAQTGRILYARSIDESRYPASLTKMMTIYLLFEQIAQGKIKLTDWMSVSAHAASQDPSKLGLEAGDSLTVEEAIKAMVVRSANDAAVVVAEYIGGSEPAFARLMTQKARALRMKNTKFTNASGLPNPLQRTTARDMAILGRALMRDFPGLYKYFSTTSFEFRGVLYESHNDILLTYAGANGIKTGYTRASGFNLVSSVERDGKRIIGVIMGGRTSLERNGEMSIMLTNIFERLKREPMLVANYDAPMDTAVQLAAAAPKPRVTAETVRNEEDLDELVLASLEEGSRAELPDAAPAPNAAPAAPEAPAIKPAEEVRVAAVTIPVPKPRPRIETQIASLAPSPAPAAPKPPAVETPRFQAAGLGFTAIMPDVAEGDNGGQLELASLAPAASGENSTEEPVAGSSWGIQVGAFSQKTSAEAQVQTILKSATDILGEAEAVVTPFKTASGVLYRVRFGPFSPKDAKAACAAFQARKVSCLAVADSDWALARN